MLRWALGFFIVALIAALLGFTGISVAAAGIAKILFYLFLILFLVTLMGHLLRRSWRKKLMKIIGIVLIVIGILALAYQGITYTTHKKVLDIGPIQATKEEHNTIPIPPILGVLALIGGVVILASDRRAP
jgi:uncharacterized membrane protein YtjA (UPF0391 family)